jgi:hypothetical protein
LVGIFANSGEKDEIVGVLLFSGFIASIALFTFGFLYGRRQRKRQRVSATV